MHSLLAEKAAFMGGITVKVDAHYPSRACPKCGCSSQANRPAHGCLLVCQNGHDTAHASRCEKQCDRSLWHCSSASFFLGEHYPRSWPKIS
ncbi:MAG: hypothetical protein IRZ31_15420 [Thermogemmatispora sp.]|uniref:hypothetical protein n=1 Tax=Thermogemmatispora sp. TaxID=1968838 RepID=UPI003412CAFF|nr:hypothetical protein [Thermogemmatispora sp.]